MIRAGDSIENPVTGERLVFRQTSRETNGAAVVIETYVQPNGFVAAAHVHPSQEERFEVLRGTVGFKVGREKLVAGPGKRLTVPAGTPHKFWNAGDEVAHFVCEIRPALQFESLIETMFSLAADGKTNRKGMPNPLHLAVIAQAHFDTVQLPFPPAIVQRLGLALGSPLGRVLGYQPVYVPAAPVGAPAATARLMRRVGSSSAGSSSAALLLAGLGAAISLSAPARRRRSASLRTVTRLRKEHRHDEQLRQPPLGPRRPALRRPLGGRDHPDQQQRPGRSLDRQPRSSPGTSPIRTRSCSAAGCSCSAASASSRSSRACASGSPRPRGRTASCRGWHSRAPRWPASAGCSPQGSTSRAGSTRTTSTRGRPRPSITPSTSSSSAPSSPRSCRSPRSRSSPGGRGSCRAGGRASARSSRSC